MWHKYLTHVLITSVCYFHPVCVQILDQLISSMHVCHRYLGIYENIAFFVNILDNLIQVVILLDYYSHPICIPIRVFTQMKTSMPSPRWWKRGFYSSKKKYATLRSIQSSWSSAVSLPVGIILYYFSPYLSRPDVHICVYVSVALVYCN